MLGMVPVAVAEELLEQREDRRLNVVVKPQYPCGRDASSMKDLLFQLQ